MRAVNPMRSVEPHPDHFDPTKFGPDGNPVGAKRGRPSGQHARMDADTAEQLMFLDEIVRTAERDLADALTAAGFDTKPRQIEILNRLRRGWRPKRSGVPRETSNHSEPTT